MTFFFQNTSVFGAMGKTIGTAWLEETCRNFRLWVGVLFRIGSVLWSARFPDITPQNFYSSFQGVVSGDVVGHK